MTLKKAQTGDTITERFFNNKAVRKGLTSDISVIANADLELGDHFFDEDEECGQVLILKSPNKWSNTRSFIGADSNEVSQINTTPVQVKDIDWIKEPVGGFSGNKIFIVARLRNSNSGNNATLIVEKDGGPTDELTLTTSSTSYVTVKGTIDVSADGNGLRTLEFFLNSGAAPDTAFLKQLEIWGV